VSASDQHKVWNESLKKEEGRESDPGSWGGNGRSTSAFTWKSPEICLRENGSEPLL